MQVVAVGASAGGVEALRTVVARLPRDFPAAVLVVLHMPASSPSVLPNILSRHGVLPAERAEDGVRVASGRIYVAPPDFHLTLEQGALHLRRGPRENGHRPAIDPLFRSVALECGADAVGVVLSGTLDDGAAGLAALVGQGAGAVVQDPEDALYPGMPRAALVAAPDAEVVPARAVAAALARLTDRDTHHVVHVSDELPREGAVARLDENELREPGRPGELVELSCPDCHGPLYALDEGPIRHYRCRVGHAWSTESLTARQASAVENALWLALRTLEDKVELNRRIMESAGRSGARHVVNAAQRSADEAKEHAVVIRSLLAGQSESA